MEARSMNRILRGLVVAAVVAAGLVGFGGTGGAHIAHADGPFTPCTNAQDGGMQINNACWWYDGYYVNQNGSFGYGNCYAANAQRIDSWGYTQGSPTHGWFHCTFVFSTPNPPPGSNVCQLYKENEFLDVYADGSYYSHSAQAGCA